MSEPTSELLPINQPENSSTGESPGARVPETPAGERIIDMVRGPDGKWTARHPEDPAFFYDPKPTNHGQRESVSPRDVWRAAEQRRQQKEAQRQQELQNLQTEGTRLAALVYTPEGQQQIAETRARLFQIVEATSRKPKMETVHPGSDRSLSAIAEVRARNEQLIQAWLESNKARVERLLQGEDMNNLEASAYLTSVLGQELQPTTNPEENKKRKALLDLFDRQRRDIGRALLYQSSDTQPVERRYLIVSQARLRFNNIGAAQAQESFAKGWDEVKGALKY